MRVCEWDHIEFREGDMQCPYDAPDSIIFLVHTLFCLFQCTIVFYSLLDL